MSYELNAVLTLRNNFSRQLRDVTRDMRIFNRANNDTLRDVDSFGRRGRSAFSGIASSAASTAGQLGLIAGAAGGVAFAFDSVNKAMNFEEQMSTIKALTGASSKEMKEMTDLAMKLGAQTKYSSLESAQGIEELLKSGLTPAAVKAGGLEAALNLATAGGLELADAAEIMSTALNAYKDDAMSAADAADILAGTANASATSVGELSYSLAAVSAVASGVGMSFRDTNIALGLFANNGLRGSDAGTSLKTMLSNLSPKTDAAYGAFEDLGLITFDATRGMQVLAENGIKPASNSINDVRAALEQFAMKTVGATKYTAKAKKEFANMGAVTGFMNNAFYDSKGNLEDLDVISGALKKSLSSLSAEQRQNALYTMFGSDAIRAGNILYKEGAEGVKNFNKEMSKVTALDVAKEKLNNAKGAVEQFKGAMETLQIAVMTPLLPLIKRAALNFADFVGGLKPEQIKSFGDQVSGAFESVYDKAVSVASFIKNNWPAVKEVIIGATTAVIAYKAAMAGLTVVSVITRLIQSYRQATVTMTAAQWALNIAMDANLFGVIAAAIAGVIAVGVLLYRNWDTIKKKAVELWDRAGILKTGLLALTGPIGLVIAAGVNLYKNWDKVKDTAKSAFSGIGKFIDGMKAKFDGFVSTVKAFDITDYEVGMPKWAGGDGVVHRKSHYHGIANVGRDNYPATLHKGERVLTAKENRQYTRARAGGGITINMGGVTIREEADIDKIVSKIARGLKEYAY